MKKPRLFIAATGQNVGKTTTCLGLLAGLKKRYPSVGFIKPVGQEHRKTKRGILVDKDVLLFQSYFRLKDPEEEMSPLLLPRGFTRDYLSGKIERGSLVEKITHAFTSIASRHAITLVEGTGHTGVGSIIDLNNAQVASLLDCPLLLIASGGLGSSFDDLALNYIQCQKYGVKVAGVVLNRVLPEKREMIEEFMPKALQKWGVPLLGSIPYDPFLSMPTMKDFELLFETELLTGEKFRFRHFDEIRLVATSVELYRPLIHPNLLIITPAAREDIILATLAYVLELKISHPHDELVVGIVLTGKDPPKKEIVEEIRKLGLPMLYTPIASFAAMKKLNAYTGKIREEDTAKIEEAIQVVERHLDFDRLIASL